MIPYVCGSRTSRSTSRPCSRVLYPAARLQKEVLQISCNPRCCHKFPCNFLNRLMVPKMILRLAFVDFVCHIASPISVRHVVLSEYNASLSLERASNCTKVQYFVGVFKYSFMARSLFSSDRLDFHPYRVHHPSDSL